MAAKQLKSKKQKVEPCKTRIDEWIEEQKCKPVCATRMDEKHLLLIENEHVYDTVKKQIVASGAEKLPISEATREFALFHRIEYDKSRLQFEYSLALETEEGVADADDDDSPLSSDDEN